jgi:hypothetical protein
MIMEALAKGWGEPTKLIVGDPPDDQNEVALYGQCWGTERILPKALRRNRTWWYIDNGYYRPGRGSPNGYYRMCFKSMTPILLRDADPARAIASQVRFKPWRQSGSHIVFAVPGADYGHAMGLCMWNWQKAALAEVRHYTDRPIKVRKYGSLVPLADDLRDAHALVTYASNVAVEAVIAGVPVFVAPGAAPAPVGNTDLADLERPNMPDRTAWWRSLMCQQFRPDEMADGTAYRFMTAVRAQVQNETINR